MMVVRWVACAVPLGGLLLLLGVLLLAEAAATAEVGDLTAPSRGMDSVDEGREVEVSFGQRGGFATVRYRCRGPHCSNESYFPLGGVCVLAAAARRWRCDLDRPPTLNAKYGYESIRGYCAQTSFDEKTTFEDHLLLSTTSVLRSGDEGREQGQLPELCLVKEGPGAIQCEVAFSITHHLHGHEVLLVAGMILFIAAFAVVMMCFVGSRSYVQEVVKARMKRGIDNLEAERLEHWQRIQLQAAPTGRHNGRSVAAGVRVPLSPPTGRTQPPSGAPLLLETRGCVDSGAITYPIDG